MRRQRVADPYRAVIHDFNKRGIHYVVVGMAGINYYAKGPRETFATMDYDILIEPLVSNVQRAVQILEVLGFEVGTTTGRITPQALQQIIRERKTIAAITPEGLMVELLLKVSGYPFAELARDAVTFTVRGVPVRVGRLDKLLRSKQLAGRPKDRHFLKRYQLLLEEGPR